MNFVDENSINHCVLTALSLARYNFKVNDVFREIMGVSTNRYNGIYKYLIRAFGAIWFKRELGFRA